MLFWLREKQGRKEERRGAGGEDEEGTGRGLGSEGGMTSEGKTRQSSQLLSPGLERGERGKEHRSRSRKKQIYSPATTSMNAKSDNKTIRHPKWTSRRFKGKLEKKWQVRFANTLWLLPSTERPSPSPFLSAVKKEKKKVQHLFLLNGEGGKKQRTFRQRPLVHSSPASYGLHSPGQVTERTHLKNDNRGA